VPCDEKIPADDWLGLDPALVVDDAGHATGQLKFAGLRVLAWSGTWFKQMDLKVAWLRLMAMAVPPTEPAMQAAVAPGETDAKPPAGRRGRKPGSGALDDDAALCEML
jgi:hypothetical protein